jgi:mxaJ protein
MNRVSVCWIAGVVVIAGVANALIHTAAWGGDQTATPGQPPVKKDASSDAPKPHPKKVLRIGADPNNLPFTNERRDGFENKIADILAEELGADIEYAWRAQRRGFFRNALKEGECDVVLGVPVGFDMALTTAPYYRSTYVFVTRKDRKLGIRSLDDPVLKKLKIGVQMIGNDGANTPPAHALASRGIIDNVVGYTVYGDYRDENPPAQIIDAVAKWDIDVAVAWGPMAGYFAKNHAVELETTPVEPAIDRSGLPFTFAISMGVHKRNKELKELLDAILKKRKSDIDKILNQYGVPQVEKPVACARRSLGKEEVM